MPMQPIRGYHARGRYPDSEHKLRHLYRNRSENGLAKAFAKVQGCVLFDADKLDSLLAGTGRKSF